VNLSAKQLVLLFLRFLLFGIWAFSGYFAFVRRYLPFAAIAMFEIDEVIIWMNLFHEHTRKNGRSKSRTNNCVIIFTFLKRYYCISDGKSRTGERSTENDSRREKMHQTCRNTNLLMILELQRLNSCRSICPRRYFTPPKWISLHFDLVALATSLR
jgi:hypothetical protein